MKITKIFLTAFLAAATLSLAACSGNSAGTTVTDGTSANTTAGETTTAETTTAETTAETEPSRVNPNDPDFYILYTDDVVDFTNAPKAYVDIYKWGDSYTPVTWAQIVFKEGDGFYVKMECEETNPRAVNTEYNSNVCQDSCLEFFAIYAPEKSGNYINIEMNSISTFLCYFCESIKNHQPIDAVTDAMPEVEAYKTDTAWGVNLHVPLKMLDDAYGGVDITLGSKILMNLYKCGDKTDKPHWGSWSEVPNDTPNFHLPASFSEVEIKNLQK